MPIRSPSLVELHAFLAVARTGSFRRAADDLCVTQAAVSRAVMRLEAELGQDVLRRTSTGVELTPAGATLRKLVEKPVAALEDAASKLMRQPERLRLRLAVITSLGSLWLMPRLADFRARHPEVEIEFRQYHHDEDFMREDVDLWIDNKPTANFRFPRHVAAQYLVGREIVAVCAPELARNVRTAQKLLALPLLYHSNYPGNWGLWAKAHHVAVPARADGLGFDLVMNLVDAARKGMGVAVVQQCMVERDLEAGSLVVPVAGTASTGRGYYLCRRRAQLAHPAAQIFSDWVTAQAKTT
jgi:DNA-binding transcriptional LysR family regulator